MDEGNFRSDFAEIRSELPSLNSDAGLRTPQAVSICVNFE